MVERRPYKAKVYGSSPYGPIYVKTFHTRADAPTCALGYLYLGNL